MYTKSMLGVDQCQAAINAMIAEYKKDPSRPPIAMAIVDDTGNLYSFARTDGARVLLVRNCVKKAYTSAISGADLPAYVERLKSMGTSVADAGDPMFINAMGGGIVIRNPADGTILGGIGVAGLPSGEADEDIAKAGLKAMNI